jgi:hypothetical protein
LIALAVFSGHTAAPTRALPSSNSLQWSETAAQQAASAKRKSLMQSPPLVYVFNRLLILTPSPS